MKPLISRRYLAVSSMAVVLWVSSANAQSGGPYDLRWNTIGGGGVTFASGGAFMLGGTAGQPDAGALTGGPYVLAGGFWPGVSAGAAPAPTPTQTGPLPATSTATAVAAATATMIASSTSVPAPTATLPGMATPTATGSRAPTSTRTPTATGALPPTPTPTATPATVCVGDCRDDGAVTVDELITGVNIGLESLPVDACPAFDANGDGAVTVNELITGVNNALAGCPEAEGLGVACFGLVATGQRRPIDEGR